MSKPLHANAKPNWKALLPIVGGVAIGVVWAMWPASLPTCSSSSATDTVRVILKEQFNKIFNLTSLYDVNDSNYMLDDITTVKTDGSTRRCEAQLNIVFELSKGLKEEKQKNPAGFQSLVSNNFREALNNTRSILLEYGLKTTDAGKTVVTIYNLHEP